MMHPVTIDFINGYLAAISHVCSGCNFVPVYGAIELELNSQDVETALASEFGSSVGNVSLRSEGIKSLISYVLEGWVGNRLFEGKLKEYKVSPRKELYQLRSNLQEYIEGIVSEKHELFSFKLNHKDFGNGAEALCFHGNNRCLFIYFGSLD